jgi:hypothetical protein
MLLIARNNSAKAAEPIRSTSPKASGLVLEPSSQVRSAEPLARCEGNELSTLTGFAAYQSDISTNARLVCRQVALC